MKNLVLVMVVIPALLAGCSGHRDQPPGTEENDPAVLRLQPDADRQVNVSPPILQDVAEEVDLGGRAEFDPNFVTKVYPLVNGKISSVCVNQGTVIHRGDVLAEIYSGDVASAVSDFQKATASLRTAGKGYARAKELAEAKIISQRELLQAAADSAQAFAEYNRTMHVLQLLDASSDSSSAVYRLRAPIDGVVLERFAQIGSQVRSDNNQPLFTIGRTGSLWVSLDVYQNQLGEIAVGDKAVLSFDGLADLAITAKITYVSPVIDASTMTAKARCEVENRGGKIKPQMFCSARVFHPKGTGLFLPSASAFFGDDGKSYVFARLGDCRYQKREVFLGKTFPDRVEVVKGISPRDSIVSDRAIFLNEELLLTSK